MRIIKGIYKTRRFKFPKKFPSRPTTDFAKEGLFNILEHRYPVFDLEILDLCAGTGSISFEFLSREFGHVVAVDKDRFVVNHLRKTAQEIGCEEDIEIIQSDIFRYLDKTVRKFDLIFADPPYEFKDYDEIVEKVFNNDLLSEKGVLIIEHSKYVSLENLSNFTEGRKYGSVFFSFFKKEKKE